MTLARVAGHDVFHQSFGTGDRRALMIHAALAHSGAWRGLAAQLPLNAVAFDLPGHGQSDDWDGQGDFLTCVTRIAEEFRDCHGGGATDVIGHSFGGIVALRLAVERPDLVRSLTLIEPVFFAAARATAAPEIAEHDIANAPFAKAMEQGDYPGAAKIFLAMWQPGARWAALPEPLRTAQAARMPLITAGAPGFDADNAGLLDAGRLEGVTVPVLLLRGEETPAIIAAVHRALMERLPDARDVVVDGAGHMLAITHPDQVAREMLPHLARAA